MSKTEHRHERLAVRLSLIISRLVAGETLDMRLLAAEFGVSVRTLRRDFRERLMYLDLEYRDGTCRLLSGSHQRELAVLTFARQSGVEALFPDMDNHMVRSLLSGPGESPCLIWSESVPLSPSRPGIFTRLIRAISEHRRVTLLAEGCRCSGLAPYRLVFCDGQWYLTGEHQQRVTVFPLNDIHAVTFHPELFVPDIQIRTLLADPDLIRALPHFHVFHLLLAATCESLLSPKE
ncbi:TPA: WYL domain-containing protein [Klebsiella aerogenes]|nr:WYL domain-containing protein [Klebsiella aerogenes]